MSLPVVLYERKTGDDGISYIIKLDARSLPGIGDSVLAISFVLTADAPASELRAAVDYAAHCARREVRLRSAKPTAPGTILEPMER